MTRIAVISAGLGTAKSVANLVKAANFEVDLVTEAGTLSSYSHIILPGVGHFQEGVKQLEKGGWPCAIQDEVRAGKLLLGICLGMQLIGSRSEEATQPGLSLIDFESTILKSDNSNKVPHMGWSDVNLCAENHLLSNFETTPRFYFVHSYAVPVLPEFTLATTNHSLPFTSVVGKDNVFGVQFHPEKSHSYGKKLITNFLGMSY